MTIYESLGLDKILLDESQEIPKEMIIDSLENRVLKDKAEKVFQNIDKINLVCSVERKEHYLQVVEISLNKAEEIETISRIIQSAIKYRVLFIYKFRSRYLILWRSFKVTESTEHVYTDHTTSCTNWIYGEYLTTDILCNWNFWDIEETSVKLTYKKIVEKKNDNGDASFFSDIFRNVLQLNDAVTTCELISCRALIDWLNTHAIGEKVDKKELYCKIAENSLYTFVDEHLFFEKNSVANCIIEQTRTMYDVVLDYTGKNPMEYYAKLPYTATFQNEDNVFSIIKHEESSDTHDEEYYIDANGNYKETDTSGGGYYIEPNIGGGKSPFVDDIIRRWKLRGYLVIEEQEVRVEIIRKLRRAGYQVFEQLKNETFDKLPLNLSEKIETLRFLDKNGMRTQDSSVEEYPDLDEFFAKTIFCEECGLPVQDFSYDREKILCESCKERKVRLLSIREFILEITRINTTNEFVSYEFTSDLELTCFRDEYQRLKLVFASIEFNDRRKKTYEELDRENCIEDEEKRTFDLQLEQNIQFRLRWRLYVSSEELKNIRFLTYYFVDDNNKSYKFVYKLKYKSGLLDNYAIEEYDYLIEDVEINHFDEENYKTIRSLDIEDFDLSVRAYNCLKRANIHSMVDLLKKTVDEILLIRNLGRKCVIEILQKLDELGLRVKNFSKEEYPDIVIGVDTIIREKHMKEATKLKVAVCKPEYVSYTNGRTGFTLYINLINQHTAPFKLKLKECAILKNDRQYISDYNYSGYAFDEGYVFPDTNKTIGKIWITEAWESPRLKDGDMFTISLIDVGQTNELFYKYIYRNEEWVFYDYYEIEE